MSPDNYKKEEPDVIWIDEYSDIDKLKRDNSKKLEKNLEKRMPTNVITKQGSQLNGKGSSRIRLKFNSSDPELVNRRNKNRSKNKAAKKARRGNR